MGKYDAENCIAYRFVLLVETLKLIRVCASIALVCV